MQRRCPQQQNQTDKEAPNSKKIEQRKGSCMREPLTLSVRGGSSKGKVFRENSHKKSDKIGGGNGSKGQPPFLRRKIQKGEFLGGTITPEAHRGRNTLGNPLGAEKLAKSISGQVSRGDNSVFCWEEKVPHP